MTDTVKTQLALLAPSALASVAPLARSGMRAIVGVASGERYSYGRFKKTSGLERELEAAGEEGEMYFLQEMLPKTFYYGSPETRKLRNTKITTAFVYCAEYVVKVQQVSGEYQGVGRSSTDDVYADPRVFIPASPSRASGAVQTICLLTTPRGSTVRGVKHGQWIRGIDGNMNCCTVTLYENDLPTEADYVYIDTKKYLERDSKHKGCIECDSELLVMSARRLTRVNHWELQRSADPERTYPVPIDFIVSVPDVANSNADDHDTMEVLNKLHANLQRLVDWLHRQDGDAPAIQVEPTAEADARRILAKLFSVAGKNSYPNCHAFFSALTSRFDSRVIVRHEKLRRAYLMTMQFGGKTFG